MKGIIFFLLFFVSFFIAAGECTITCKARYLHRVFHPPVPPAYTESKTLGRFPLAGTGSDGYYENVWSNTYILNVQFYSGLEFKASSVLYSNFEDNAIVALVKWNDGGSSLIVIENWTTKLKTINQKEVMYDDKTGKKIPKITGYDKEGRFWEFYFE
jgi:hypothetical protein